MALSSKSEVKSSDLLLIGQIVAAHGLTGAVKVKPLTDFPERFERLKDVYLLATQDACEGVQVTVRAVPYPMKQNYVVAFTGIQDRTHAESVVRQYVAVPRHQAVPLPVDTFYLHQLEGLQVRDGQGGVLGMVTGIIPGAQDLLEMTMAEKTHLVPFVKALVPAVNLEEGWLCVDLPDGLLEL